MTFWKANGRHSGCPRARTVAHLGGIILKASNSYEYIITKLVGFHYVCTRFLHNIVKERIFPADNVSLSIPWYLGLGARVDRTET